MTLEKEALAGEAINIGDKWDYADLLVQVGIIKEKEKAMLDMRQSWADTDKSSDMSLCPSPYPKQTRT